MEVGLDDVTVEVQVAQGIAFTQRLAFELQANGGAHCTMRAFSFNDVGTFETLE